MGQETDELLEVMNEVKATKGFYVKQHWEALEEISSCYEQKNTYTVSDIAINGGKAIKGRSTLFEAEEDSGFCSRFCCGENRGFEFEFRHPTLNKTMVQIERGYRCCGWAVIPCCAHRVDVHYMLQPSGSGAYEVVGSTSDKTLAAQVQVPEWHGGCCCPTFYLKNHEKEYMGKISGYSCWCCPCVMCDICGADFYVRNKEGDVVGKVEKLGVSNCKDCLLELKTEADKYTVTFEQSEDESKNLDLNFKLAVLASVIQIDFNFFEDKRGLHQCHCCDVACCGYALPCLPLFCLAACCCDTKDKKDKDKLHK